MSIADVKIILNSGEVVAYMSSEQVGQFVREWMKFGEIARSVSMNPLLRTYMHQIFVRHTNICSINGRIVKSRCMVEQLIETAHKPVVVMYFKVD